MRAALAVGLALLPPAVGYLDLPAAREGAPLPETGRTRTVPVGLLDEVVLIGNSKAGTDIDIAAVRAAAGRPDLRMSAVSIGSATLPVYYAAVKNAVFTEAKPKVIIVYATRVELLAADLTADRRETLLHPYLTRDEPVIARKLYARPPDGLAGLRERAVTARDLALGRLAESAAAAVSGPPGREHLDAAFTEVFGQTWAVRERPDAAAVRGGAYPSESPLAQELEDSFIVEMEAMCHEHGARLVFAIAPVSGKIRAREERRLRGLEPVLAQAATHGDAWIDLPQPDEDPANWRDGEHLNPQAARVVSTALGEALAARGLVEAPTRTP